LAAVGLLLLRLRRKIFFKLASIDGGVVNSVLTQRGESLGGYLEE
jgi:hypothetical protein